MVLERIVNNEILALVEDHYSRYSSPLHIVYEAPTGYGKTSLAPHIASVVDENGLSTGYIHVLPMRSMVRKIYEELRRGGRKSSVCYQAGGLLLPGKNPFLSCSTNITTFDSFMLNLVRVGVGEASSHYEAARSMIFTSTIVYDEAHLYGGDPGNPEEDLYTSFLVSLEAMVYARSPTIVMTATLPEQLAERIYDTLVLGSSKDGSKVLWVRYGRSVKAKNISHSITCVDKEYDKLVENVEWTTVITRDDLASIARSIAEEALTGEKILVVLNKPARAARIYDHLINSGLKPLLLHGRMKYGEREELEKKISEAEILVATQVVEAGINVSYDTLYTDLAPISNLIQRAGRVNRWFTRDKSRVVLISDREAYENIYPEDIVANTLDTIKYYLEKGRLNWRSPYTTYELIERTYRGRRVSITGVIDLKYFVMASSIGKKELHRDLYMKCLGLKGFVRNSILIPLVHLGRDKDYDIQEIYRNTIPVSFPWVLSKRKQLFTEKTVALLLKQDRSGELMVEEESVNTTDTNVLKKEVCKYICYPGRGVFLGLVIRDDAYRDWRGLLV